MPKGSKWGVNEKAEEARARKANKKQSAAERKAQEEESAAWQDQGSTAKEQRAKEKEAKALERARKKQEKEELRKKEEEELARIKGAKSSSTNKVTAFQLAQMKEQRQIEEQAARLEAEQKQNRIAVPSEEIPENTNQLLAEQKEADEARYGADGVVDAASLTEALTQLSASDITVERNPEKRAKAAQKAFEAVRLPELRAEFPSLKRSQLAEKLWKEWKKHPDNPIVQAAAAAMADTANGPANGRGRNKR